MQPSQEPVTSDTEVQEGAPLLSGSRRVGELIRRTREGKGFSIEEMSRFTHIQPVHLRALEAGDPSLLPGPTFVVGFLRLYLRSLGLPEQELVEQYVALLDGQNNSLYFSAPTTPKNRPSWQLVASGVLLLALAWTGYEIQLLPANEQEAFMSRLRFWQETGEGGGSGESAGVPDKMAREAPTPAMGSPLADRVDVEPPPEEDEEEGAATPTPPAATPAAAPVNRAPAPPAPPAAIRATPATPVTTTPAVAATPAVGRAAVTPVAPAVTATPSASATPAVTATPAVPAAPAVTATPAADTATATAAGTSGAAPVVLVADSDVWVQFKDKNGKVVKEMVMRQGQRHEVVNGNDLTMTVGNAGGLRFQVGDKELPPLGQSGSVVRNLIPTAESLQGRATP